MKMAGYKVKITHDNKILYPNSGISKGNLIAYYDKIADHMLPYLKDRPLTLHRFPRGISDKGFFQKNASDYFPDWIQTAKVTKKGGWVNHVICDTSETLVYLVNQGTITFHIALSRIDNLEYPDKLIFDLDPPNANFEVVVEGAKTVRDFLENKLGLTAFVMTTGSKGLHIVVPLNRTEHFDEVHDFSKHVAQYLSNEHPEKYTTAIRKDQRKSRLFIDYVRNSYGQTGVCPFSVRAFEGAPVAVPLDWEELNDDSLNARTYNIQNIFYRLIAIDHPWAAFEKQSKSIGNAKKELKRLMKKYAEQESD